MKGDDGLKKRCGSKKHSSKVTKEKVLQVSGRTAMRDAGPKRASTRRRIVIVRARERYVSGLEDFDQENVEIINMEFHELRSAYTGEEDALGFHSLAEGEDILYQES
ncbi:hypothetical protein Tco_0422882 [Tanacetum coccineum]